jgi:glutamine phosphoribosylpyrophosphate amidotransferase
MCEHFVAVADRPFRIDELYPFVERLERYGIAGFGWGAAWHADGPGGGHLESHRDVRAFRDDPGRESVGRNETRSLLVHLRRPSRLSTLTLADTQPFDDPAGRFAFSHNGDLRDFRSLRRELLAAGRIHGRADTEVGERWLEDAWQPERPVADLLGSLHQRFGGQANLALLAQDGRAYHYAGNGENPVFTCELGPIRVASTGIYSLDRSLFRYVAPDARKRRLIRVGSTAVLNPGVAAATRA